MPNSMQDCSKKLLVVDDAPAIRASFSSLLAEIGYLVRTAGDGFEALAHIQADPPDVLLSDLNMPGMSGFELLSVVRLRYPAMQVIAMSGSFSGEEVPSGVIADAFYQKGSSVRSLLRLIEGMSHPRSRPRPGPSRYRHLECREQYRETDSMQLESHAS